jgi:hypothetical protein
VSDYASHGEFKPDQVVTGPEPSILAEMDAEAMGEGDSPASSLADHQKQDDKLTDDDSAPLVDVAGVIVRVNLSIPNQ